MNNRSNILVVNDNEPSPIPQAQHQRLTEPATSYVYTVIIKDGMPMKNIHRPGCELITGHTMEEFNADPGLWYRIIHENDRPLVFGLTQLMLLKPDKHTLEHRILHKDGFIRWVSNTMIPCRNRQGSRFPESCAKAGLLISYDGIIIDITKRKTLETDFKHGGKMTFDKGARKPFLILIVDDDALVCQKMVSILSKTFPSIRFIVAENGAVGLEMFKEHQPDMVITDNEMPIMTGTEMASEIRSLDAETTILFLTAALNRSSMPPLNSHLMKKPVNMSNLFGFIDSHVPRT